MIQALYENGHLVAGKRGLGFGCGAEPLASYLASQGILVTATDLAPDQQYNKGWAETGQHAASLDHIFKDWLVDRETFATNVTLHWVDMNNIPTGLRDYDFCWSVCSLEHLGSIKLGLDFIEKSIETLKQGGVAIHTTEFNFWNDAETIDNWPTVLFQKRHFEEIKDRLEAQGHWVAPLDFDVGSGPMDRFIDLPPFVHDWPAHMQDQWGDQSPHLKLSIDGFASTCFGLIVRKGH